MKILFDADSLVYGCGFATQRTVYDYTCSAPDGSDWVEGIAQTKDEVQAVEAMAPEGWVISSTPLAEAEPLEYALALAKRQLLRVEEDLSRGGYQFDKIELFLSGKGNFRDEIATIKPYKGNRTLEKPIHYRSIRRYLINRWGATVVHGWEADDQVASLSATLDHDPEKVMIISQDKDLRTVPGLLYNYRKRTFEFVTKQAALTNFYRQIITGDAVDNISGIYKAGDKAAKESIHEGMTEREMYEAVLALCASSFSKKGCPYSDKSPEAVILELGRLLHMYRTKPPPYWEAPQP